MVSSYTCAQGGLSVLWFLRLSSNCLIYREYPTAEHGRAVVDQTFIHFIDCPTIALLVHTIHC